MHTLEKPVRRNFSTDALGLGFAKNRGADGSELQTDADVVQKAGRLLRVGSALGLAGDEIFQRRSRQPKWMLDIHFMGVRRPFLDNIDRIMGGDAFFAVAGDIILRRVLVRMNDQTVDLANRIVSEFGDAHAGKMQSRLYPVGIGHAG